VKHAHGHRLSGRFEEDIDFPNNGRIPSAIPDGDDYEVSYVGYDKVHLWNQDKLILHFRLVTPGAWFGEEFYMVCKIAKNGQWTPSAKYWRMWVLANGKQPLRHDRLSTKVFRNKVFRARMRTVTTTFKRGVARRPEQQYSVIDELLEVRAGC
jgi:hypothetical protein